MVKQKVSDVVADFFASKSVKHVFAISGGASLHLIHSIASHPSIDYICNHHEQASAMSADAYSRITGNIGVAIATSGPGATNLITGLCCSYYDSVPVIVITGQVSRTRMTGDTGVRQIGFQETPIIEMCNPITKYSAQVLDKSSILFELQKAYYIATSGRPGPVLVDIPDDVQREFVDLSTCPHFSPATLLPSEAHTYPDLQSSIDYIIAEINKSSRPVIIAGWGVHISKFENQLIKFAEAFSIPIALTWAAFDLLPSSHPLRVGTFGTHGQRHANFAVQNADLIISFGSRLDTKSTGTPVSSFATGAKKIVVDIDPNELSKFSKFGLNIDRLILQDLSEASLDPIIALSPTYNHHHNATWINKINKWNTIFDSFDNEFRKQNCTESINPYLLFHSLGNLIINYTNVIFDTGCSLAWGMQALKCNKKIRTYHDFNNTAMGWSLPASIASSIAMPNQNTICVVGDGSFMMMLHELAVIKRHKLPIKILLFNNSGYSMIQQTQDQWLESDYVASSYHGGLDFPNYSQLADSFDLHYFELNSNDSINQDLSNILSMSEGVLCNIIISDKMRVTPQVKAGYPNEQLEPLLPSELFNSEMIISSPS